MLKICWKILLNSWMFEGYVFEIKHMVTLLPFITKFFIRCFIFSWEEGRGEGSTVDLERTVVNDSDLLGAVVTKKILRFLVHRSDNNTITESRVISLLWSVLPIWLFSMKCHQNVIGKIKVLEARELRLIKVLEWKILHFEEKACNFC